MGVKMKLCLCFVLNGPNTIMVLGEIAFAHTVLLLLESPFSCAADAGKVGNI